MTLRLSLLALVAVVAALCIAGSFAGATYCYFSARQAGGANTAAAWTSVASTETTSADFAAGLPASVDTSGDQVRLAASATGPVVYALRGGGSTAFWRYDVWTNAWTALAPVPGAVGAGGALAYPGGDYLYALRGGGTRNVYRYSISGGTWSTVTQTPSAVDAGGALATDGTYLYALRGDTTRNYWRYSPSAGTWISRANIPRAADSGAALAYVGAGRIYGQRGGQLGTFYLYGIAGDQWQDKPPAALGNGYEPGDGGALASNGTHVFLHSGVDENSARNRFSIYAIGTDLWTHSTTPYLAGAGGALAADGSAYVYALQGGSAAGFWRFTTAANTWAALATTPAAVGAGGSLAYVPGGPGGCYVSPGSVASVVYDTGTAGSRWDMLAWNASVPAGTGLSFEVRSSGTGFAANATSPGWTAVTATLSGGRYVATSPLPAGRYHQWRATLSSTLCGVTPALYDATAYFSDEPLSGAGVLSFGASLARSGLAAVARGAAPAFSEIPAGTIAPEPTPTAAPAATPTANATVTPTATVTANATVNDTPAVTVNATATATTVPAATRAVANETPSTAVPNVTVTANATATPAPTGSVAATTTPRTTNATPAAVENRTAVVATTAPPPSPTIEPPSLGDLVSADRNLTVFAGLVRAAGLEGLLDDPGNRTVFAPTDDAFAALTAGSLAALRADPARLGGTIRSHVTEGRFGADELSEMGEISTLGGYRLTLSLRGRNLTAGNATVLSSDERAGNGALHVVDAVLLPIEVPTPLPSASPSANVTAGAPVPPSGTPGTIRAVASAPTTTPPATARGKYRPTP